MSVRDLGEAVRRGMDFSVSSADHGSLRVPPGGTHPHPAKGEGCSRLWGGWGWFAWSCCSRCAVVWWGGGWRVAQLGGGGAISSASGTEQI